MLKKILYIENRRENKRGRGKNTYQKKKNLIKKMTVEIYSDNYLKYKWIINSNINTKETRIERDTCTPMFITALFIITRTWKQPRCPSANKWIRKLWYVYTIEYYSAIKKNTFESVVMRCKNWSLLYRVK